jgi:predicted AAA+ superfamily ATPase
MQIVIRHRELARLRDAVARAPITAILGPRQCGKTTLAALLKPDHRFDLENPRDLARLSQPQTTLERLDGLVAIDEIQRMPELFPLLRYLADTMEHTTFVVLGSASPDIVAATAESLAGRVAFHDLAPFDIGETSAISWRTHWLRGGYPRALLADSDKAARLWLDDYIRTFLERDIPQLGISIPAATLRRFWIMISHYHGQLLNYSELSRAFGVSDHTVRRYLEILEGTYMIRLLPPWHANVGKRLVKAPKLYIRDSGLFHALQTIQTLDQLEAHPKLGASWEGFAMEQVFAVLRPVAPFFWRTHAGAELDLLWHDRGTAYGMEFKYTDAPMMTRSMKTTLDDLHLARLWVVYPGDQTYPLDDRITVVPLSRIGEIVLP